MRRGFSIFLILFFGLGPLSALADSSDDASLPPCCRRHGAHHCALAAQMAARMARMQTGAAPALSAPLTCPSYPGALAAIFTPPPALTVAAIAIAVPRSRTRVMCAAHATPHSLPATTHAGRGPPVQNLI